MINFFRNRVRAIAISFAVTCALYPQARAAADDLLRYRGGLRNSPGQHKLNTKQLEAVLTSLRDKSGLLEMRFDEKGFLALGDRAKFSGGSDTARALLYAATSMSRAVELESHMYSPKVAFARIASPTAYFHYTSGAKIDVFPLEIDFSDFSKLRGARQAIAAFDLGFVILHELAHTALSLSDAADGTRAPAGPGDCETMINRVRRELNLPERQTYIAQTYIARTLAPGRSPARLAELVFARKVEKQGRMQIEKFNLNWEASAVGPLTLIEDRGSNQPRER
ncbi:MAG TPA: hypothetical protein VFS27_06895 [Blastocatellia bacterium]|jgi:hypothetical protein|nr:hypothetical protein [Blastocatellia bacterium]